MEVEKIEIDSTLYDITDAKAQTDIQTLNASLTPKVSALESTVNNTLTPKVSTLESTVNNTLTPKVSTLESTVNNTLTPKVSTLESTVNNSLTPRVGTLENTVNNSLTSRVGTLENTVNNNHNPRITALENKPAYILWDESKEVDVSFQTFGTSGYGGKANASISNLEIKTFDGKLCIEGDINAEYQIQENESQPQVILLNCTLAIINFPTEQTVTLFNNTGVGIFSDQQTIPSTLTIEIAPNTGVPSQKSDINAYAAFYPKTSTDSKTLEIGTTFYVILEKLRGGWYAVAQAYYVS